MSAPALLDHPAPPFPAHPVYDDVLLSTTFSCGDERIYHLQRPQTDDPQVLHTFIEQQARELRDLHGQLDDGPLGVIVFNARYRILHWSRGAERIFGWNEQEVLGKSIDELPWVVDEDQERVGRLRVAMSTGAERSNVTVNRNFRKDGSVLTCEWYNSVRAAPDGAMVSVLSFVHDITVQRRTDHQLRESRSRLDLALTAAHLGVWDWYLPSGKLQVDERWAAMFGRTAEELRTFTVDQWKTMCHPDDLPVRQRALQEHLEGRTDAYIVEFRFRHADGHWIWVLSRGQVIERNGLGAPVRITGVLMDIEAEKQREVQQAALVAQLQDALAHVKTLSGLLPICGSCKKIRDDSGYWTQVEHFLMDHADVSFSHSLCPECLERDFPAAYQRLLRRP